MSANAAYQRERKARQRRQRRQRGREEGLARRNDYGALDLTPWAAVREIIAKRLGGR